MKLFGNIVIAKDSDYWEEVSEYLDGIKISYYIIYDGESRDKNIQKYLDEHVPTPAGTFILSVNNKGGIDIKNFKFKIYDDNLNEIKPKDLPFKINPRMIESDVREAIKKLVNTDLGYSDASTVRSNLTDGQVELEVMKPLAE